MISERKLINAEQIFGVSPIAARIVVISEIISIPAGIAPTGWSALVRPGSAFGEVGLLWLASGGLIKATAIMHKRIESVIVDADDWARGADIHGA